MSPFFFKKRGTRGFIGWGTGEEPDARSCDGRADIVGFGNAGVWASLNNGNGTFQAPTKVVDNFGYSAGGWRVEKHPPFPSRLSWGRFGGESLGAWLNIVADGHEVLALF